MARVGRALPPRLDLALLGLATVAGFALRVYRLGDANIWWDEGYGIYLARKGLVALALETAGDVHPPLHYWLLHLWIRLVGEGEFAVRYSSLLFAVASIPLAYWLGRRLIGRGAGLGAALLLAASRFHVEWSQQIRMYTLVTALAMLSIAVTLALWQRPRRRLWVAHVALTTVGLHTLYLSGLVPLVESLATLLLWALPVGGRRLSFSFVVRWALAQAVALACFAPWVALFLRAPRPTPTALWSIDLVALLHASATAFPLGISTYVERYTPVTVAAFGLAALGAAALARAGRARLAALLVGLLVAPPLAIYALSSPNPVLYSPNLAVRYVLIFLPAYHLLTAAGVAWLWGRRAPGAEGGAAVLPPSPAGKGGRGGRSLAWSVTKRAAPGPRLIPFALAAVFLASTTAWSLLGYYPGRRLEDDYQTVTRYLAAYARPGDAVLLNPDRDWPIFLSQCGRCDGGLDRYGISAAHPVTADAAAALLSPILAGHAGLWVVTSYDAYDSDPAGHVPAWLAEHARLVGGVSGPHRSLRLYSTDPGRSVAAPALARPDHPADLRLEGGLAALGYDLAAAEVAPGESLRLAVYWRAPGPLPADARAALRLLDARGTLYRDARAPLRAEYPPDRWQPGQVVRADYALAIPPTMPPGTYALALGALVGGRELAPAGSATLRTIRVVGRPAAPPPAPPPSRATDALLGGRVRLAGYDLTAAPEAALSAGSPARGRLAPGTALRLQLRWEDVQAVDRPYTVFVQLVGEATNPATGNPVWAQRDAYPRSGERPTDDWVPGDVVLDDYELVVPSGAPAGRYRVQAGLYDAASGQRLPVARGGQPAGDSVVLFEGEVGG